MHDNSARRYVEGRLSPEEMEAYERHFFECDRCFREVWQLQDVQASPSVVPLRGSRLREWRRTRTWWSATATAAVAASIIGVMLLPWHREEPPRATEGRAQSTAAAVQGAGEVAPRVEVRVAAATAVDTTAPDTQSMRPTVDIAAALSQLARVEAPRYTPMLLRGPADDASMTFSKGIEAYRAGDYAVAANELRLAASLDPSRADIAFFLGVTEFLAGNARTAVTELQRTIDLGDADYADDARFFMAKAYLGLRDVEQARSHLTVVASSDSGRAAEAGELLRELERLEPQ